MILESIIGAAGLLTIAAITPGPNNLIILNLASRGGPVSAAPAMAGILTGGLSLLVLVWAGMAAVFETWPALRLIITVIGAAYLAHMGWSMMRRNSEDNPSSKGMPAGILGLAAFQLINPKAWVLTITVTAALARDLSGLALLATISLLFTFISLSCLTLWALAGQGLGRNTHFYNSSQGLNRIMGLLLIGSAILLIYPNGLS